MGKQNAIIYKVSIYQIWIIFLLISSRLPNFCDNDDNVDDNDDELFLYSDWPRKGIKPYF